MTPDPNTTDLKTLTKQQLQELCGSLTQAQMTARGVDFPQGWKLAKALFPKVWDALEALPQQPDAVTPMSNEARAAIPQPGQDDQGLYRGATPDEWNLIWKACGNSCAPEKADRGFDVLVDLCARSRGLSYEAAASAIRTRFPALAALADEIKVARKLQLGLPPTVFGSDLRLNAGSRGAGPLDFQQKPPRLPFERGAKPGPTPQDNPTNAFHVGGLGNDLDDQAVRETYADAIRKHLADHPDSGPLQAHRAVLAAHPRLAQALRGKQPDTASEDDAASVAGVIGKNDLPFPMPLSPENRRVLEWLLAQAKRCPQTEGSLASKIIPMIERKLAA
jgi:hypothetical protein